MCWSILSGGSLCDILANVLDYIKWGQTLWHHRNMLDCDIVISKFELELRYCVHFQTNALVKGMNPYPT